LSIECNCEATIRASPGDCLAAAADASRWMDWARDLEQVHVLAPLTPDSPLRVELVIEILGVEKRAVVDLAVDPATSSMSFGLVESASLSEFSGSVRFTGDGSRSRMLAQVRGTLTRSYAPRIERMASRKIETALTRDFLRFVERAARGR
jgi:hypothetical protein